MSDTHRIIELVCDGDRRPNAAREMLLVEDMIVAYRMAGGEQADVDAGTALGEA